LKLFVGVAEGSAGVLELSMMAVICLVNWSTGILFSTTMSSTTVYLPWNQPTIWKYSSLRKRMTSWPSSKVGVSDTHRVISPTVPPGTSMVISLAVAPPLR
jgi:hypothetical protein